MRKLKYLFLILIFAFPTLAQTQEVLSKSLIEQYQIEIVLGLAVIVCLVALMAMYTLLVAMKTMLKMKFVAEGVVKEKKVLLKAREGEEKLGFWSRFWNRFHEVVPVEKEGSVMMNHEYDGIRELNNRLPSWWLYSFYVSILFSVAYMINYHVGSGPNQEEEFQAEMQAATEEAKIYLASLDNLVDESSVVVLTAPADIAAGKAIYDANCAVCHANDGGGGVGPNFTDKNWIRSGDIKSIFGTIKYGVPSKGMISWETQLSPKKIQQVASYIYTLEGTIPANPKEPQGEIFNRTSSEEIAPADSTFTTESSS